MFTHKNDLSSPCSTIRLFIVGFRVIFFSRVGLLFIRFVSVLWLALPAKRKWRIYLSEYSKLDKVSQIRYIITITHCAVQLILVADMSSNFSWHIAFGKGVDVASFPPTRQPLAYATNSIWYVYRRNYDISIIWWIYTIKCCSCVSVCQFYTSLAR